MDREEYVKISKADLEAILQLIKEIKESVKRSQGRDTS